MHSDAFLGTSKRSTANFDPTNIEEPMSAFTNPNDFMPQFVRDGVSKETDPRQEAEFQPNFVR